MLLEGTFGREHQGKYDGKMIPLYGCFLAIKVHEAMHFSILYHMRIARP
jgi:hypothetical protein